MSQNPPDDDATTTFRTGGAAPDPAHPASDGTVSLGKSSATTPNATPDPNAYSQPQYGQGQPQYGQGQPQDQGQPYEQGRQSYDQGQYNQNPYGQPQYGQGQPYTQPYPPQPGYPQPAYAGYPQQPYVAAPATNTMAILALIFGIIFAPLGIVFGFIARGQIKRTGEGGSGLALAGIIIGGIFTVLIILYFVFVIIFISTVAGTIPNFPSSGSFPTG